MKVTITIDLTELAIAYTVLRAVDENFPTIEKTILKNLCYEPSDITDAAETLRESLLDHCVECGCCGRWHLPNFHGDCRENSKRF